MVETNEKIQVEAYLKMGSNISSLVFQPPKRGYLHSSSPIFWITTCHNHRIPAFHIDNQSCITLLFSHGNGEDLRTCFEWMTELSRELNVNLLAYEYEGYGGNTATTSSEQGCYDDIDAAFVYLTSKMSVPPENIVLYGRSLGSGPSLYLAERLSKQGVRIGGIILQCPFMSIFRVAFPFRFTLPYDMFPNIERIPNVRCPILVIHGTRDEVVPFWNGEGLFLNAPIEWREKPVWIIGGGHNNLEGFFRDGKIFLDHFRQFLKRRVPKYSPEQIAYVEKKDWRSSNKREKPKQEKRKLEDK